MSVDRHEMTIGLRCIRKTITIPANTGTAATISSLAALTSAEEGRYIGCKIMGDLTTGSDRGAIICGDSADSLPQYTAAGADYSEPVKDDEIYTYVKAASGAAIANTCVVFYSIASDA